MYFYVLPPEKLLQTIGITVNVVMIQHRHCGQLCSSTEEKGHPYHKIKVVFCWFFFLFFFKGRVYLLPHWKWDMKKASFFAATLSCNPWAIIFIGGQSENFCLQSRVPYSDLYGFVYVVRTKSSTASFLRWLPPHFLSRTVFFFSQFSASFLPSLSQ